MYQSFHIMKDDITTYLVHALNSVKVQALDKISVEYGRVKNV